MDSVAREWKEDKKVAIEHKHALTDSEGLESETDATDLKVGSQDPSLPIFNQHARKDAEAVDEEVMASEVETQA